MASENRASYFCIGLTVVAGLAAIVGTLVYLGGMRDASDEVLAETYYDKPVSGLSVGSTVNLRGVKIGEVREIAFIGNKYNIDRHDAGRIYILMAISKKAVGASDATTDVAEDGLRRFVTMGLRATVASSGITGIAQMELDLYRDEPEPAAISWTPRHTLIPPKVSLLDSFSESATKVMRQINRMDLNAFWSNIHASVQSVSATTLSLQHLLEGCQPELERITRNLEEAASSVREFADTIRRAPSALIRDVSPAALPETGL